MADEGADGGESAAAVERMVKIVNDISGLPECRGPLRRPYGNLARRVKLLGPLFEELKEGGVGGGADGRALAALAEALEAAGRLLQSVNEGSKLYQALKGERFLDKFRVVTGQLEKSLSEISYDKLDVSEEVREQVELVYTQFKRAKGRIEAPDFQLCMDLSLAWTEKIADPALLKRVSEKLQLITLNDLKKESLALHEMVIGSGGNPEECLEEMSTLLKKLKDLTVVESPNADVLESKISSKHRSPVIPDDFRCPISLDMMKDPVIVSTGQTYERSCIQKWLDAGHKTCPKTQQNLSHTALTPNYVLKSLIAQWCESNGVEPPKNQGDHRYKILGSYNCDRDRACIMAILEKLGNGNQEEQRAAAGEIRLLAKRNADNRVCIAKAGAIPLLVDLLQSPDSRTQEHAVTALLNLSINEGNKGIIVNAGAIPEIVEVLKHGSMEARENAAATLFSLSIVDGNKVAIGAAGAIPALVDLLCQGTPRGKRDAATAIFNLSIYQGNKVRAVRAGIVVHLMRLLADPTGEMVDEALAILAILASHQEGRLAIGHSEPIPTLLRLIRSGFPRNRENAAAVLWSLCAGDANQLRTVGELGAEEVLKELRESGTDRAKRKAGNLLELLQQS
ncbi:hypothetical protein Taro_041475 [Colocasia esculenta]|uniref:RING-type E3 ubiquitin transferase n=1 Tax=Colocasia esculenta TaxID=4460 RepID=A0A843WFY6_COLES|nr:hypothetical protein [Colocasia esculenta]